ncbi:MAG: PilZ domain-containing protein [Anaerolineales bacterium]|nr:PilZ domain-containing protein [Anaerolineales bacterium]
MTSNAQILSDLKIIRQENQPLELLTTYKGVPFVCKAWIENLEGDVARLKVDDPAILCLDYGNQTRVLGSDYFEPAVARLGKMDLANSIIELTDFTYIGTKLGERMIVRVEPGERIQVLVINEDLETGAELADISMSGIGVRMQEKAHHLALRPGAAVVLDFQLPEVHIQTSGTVLSLLKSENTIRLSIRFAQDFQQRASVFHYLIDRRAEIERELREIYSATRQTILPAS